MARYGKFFTEETANVPDIMATSSDETYTDAILRADKWFPIIEVGEPSGSPFRVFSYTLVGDENGGHIEESYTIDRPPRTISKYKLKLAIAQAGLLSQFTQLLASVEVAPGYMGDEAFRDAVTLDEDNPKFAAAVVLVKQSFGMTDEQVETILAASVAD